MAAAPFRMLPWVTARGTARPPAIPLVPCPAAHRPGGPLTPPPYRTVGAARGPAVRPAGSQCGAATDVLESCDMCDLRILTILIYTPPTLGHMAEYRWARCCRCGHQERDPISMFDHAWRRHPPAAPSRAVSMGYLIIVSPGWDAAPCSDWMLAWVPADCSLPTLARFLEQEWLLRRMDVHATITCVAGGGGTPPPVRPTTSSADALLCRRPDLELRASSGHVVSVRHVWPAPLLLDAPRGPAVLAETLPLSVRFVSADRMRAEALHFYIDDATGTRRRWIGPCAAA